MRKYLPIIFMIISLQSFSQPENVKVARMKIDSLKIILANLNGREKIDSLNKIAYHYLSLYDNWKRETDSAYPYALQAYYLSRKIKYTKGEGLALLRLGTRGVLNADFDAGNGDPQAYNKKTLDSSEKYLHESIAIGEKIKDYELIGGAYSMLSWLVAIKGEEHERINFTHKSISAYKKSTTPPINGTYGSLESSNCTNCIGNENIIGGLNANLASIYFRKKEFDSVSKYLNTAISYFEKTGEKDQIGHIYEVFALYIRNDFKQSEPYLKKAVAIYAETGNEPNEIKIIARLTAGYWSTGDFENGLEYGKRGIVLAEKFVRSKTHYRPDNNVMGNAYVWMCRLLSTAGEYETALKIIHQGRRFFPNDTASLANWLVATGEAHTKVGNYDSAFYYLRFNENNFFERTLGKENLCYLYLATKRFDKALFVANEISDWSIKKNDQGRLSMSMALASSAYYGKKDYQAALKYATKSLSEMKSYQARVRIVENYELLSNIYHQLGRNDSAYFYLREYMDLKDSLLNRQFLWKLNNYKKEAEEERKTSQINLLNKDNQLKEQKLKQQAIVKNGLIIGMLLLFLLGAFVLRSYYLKRKKQLAENERKQTELEMQALRAQMNPHFIFNCLSSINKYILKNEPDTASDYLTRFSRLIRMVLLNSQRSLITLEDELDMLTIYLDMERMRFKNTFNYNIIFANRVDADAIFIPPLLLQPFCENAIWHGLKPLADHEQIDHEPGRLDIILSMEDKVLYCSITDNGIGRKKAAEIRSKSAEEKKSLGLKITAERLALLNQEKNEVTSYEIEDLQDENGNAAGTKINLRISYKETIEEYV